MLVVHLFYQIDPKNAMLKRNLQHFTLRKNVLKPPQDKSASFKTAFHTKVWLLVTFRL